ncbi:MAG TPA: inositol monophosphatase family protein [Kofleriaceae bacterium]|nr:inositol monophosphatase family protein [Kofleriaceae bacterium]
MVRVPDPPEALAIARGAAAAAVTLLQGARGHITQVREKTTVHDLVTEWDTRAEATIIAELARACPGVPVLAEEGGGNAPAGGARWVVDPIDGTINFIHGVPFYGVSIALEVAGEPVAGVVAAPALGWEFAAAKTLGATLNGEPLAVSGTTELARALLASGFPYHRARSEQNFAEWAEMLRRAGACRRFGAASLDLCMVAAGWLDGYWEYDLKAWDMAAGIICIREAGGRVTQVLPNGPTVASNGAIHEELVHALSLAR